MQYIKGQAQSEKLPLYTSLHATYVASSMNTQKHPMKIEYLCLYTSNSNRNRSIAAEINHD